MAQGGDAVSSSVVEEHDRVEDAASGAEEAVTAAAVSVEHRRDARRLQTPSGQRSAVVLTPMLIVSKD